MNGVQLNDPHPHFTIALIQMRCEKGAMADNLRFIREQILLADARGVDVIAFPEMCITGYADPTRYPEALLQLDGPEISAVLEMTHERAITVLAGLIEQNPAGKPFITQVVIRNGVLVGFYRKITIIDEEAEWFSPGKSVPVFTHSGITFGMAICADIDNESVFADCARQGARIVFELAAPGLYGEQSTRDWHAGYDWWETKCREQLSAYAQKHGIWIAVVTQAGRTVDEDFPSGGFLFAPDGKRIFATPHWLPGSEYLSIDLKHSKSN